MVIKLIKSLFKPKPTPEPIQIQTIPKSQLQQWLKNKQIEHQENETKFLKPIKERIKILTTDLNQEINNLQTIDLEDRKVNERVKSIITGNIENYLNHLQEMIDKLNGINKRKNLIEKVNEIFKDFNKKTHISSQKISHLLAKEISSIRSTISQFLKDLEEILKSNKDNLEEFNTIESVSKLMDETEKIKENQKTILEVLNKDNLELKKLKQELSSKQKQITDIENSEELKKEQQKQIDLEERNKKLDKKIYDLKALIDFKKLSNFYHAFEDEMNLIKNYKNNFKEALESEKKETLINLLEGSKLNNDKITTSIEFITKEKENLKNTTINDFGLENIRHQIDIHNNKIASIESKKEIKNKKLKEHKKEEELVLEKIKQELKKIYVEVE